MTTSTPSPTAGGAGYAAVLGAALDAHSHQDAPRASEAAVDRTLRGRPIVTPLGELAVLTARRRELEEEVLALWEG